jgi:glycosyltransferase involved in cell wall biosynthesis
LRDISDENIHPQRPDRHDFHHVRDAEESADVNKVLSQMTAPIVTVLINAYNYGRFIEEAIDSVLSQDFPMDKVEILVIDDGSTDDTAERVKKYGSRIRYFYKPNGGQGSAFNLGFKYAQGDIIALLDADDYFLPGKLRRIVEEFQNRPETGMIYHPLLELDVNSGEFRQTQIALISGFLPDDTSKLLAYRSYPTSGMVFRRQALAEVLPMPETIRLQADAYVSILIPLVAPVFALPEPLSVYRVHGQNLYHSQDQTLSPERRKSRTDTLTTISNELKAWAEYHRHRLVRREARLFLNHWLLSIQEMRFLMDPPGRLLFFWFLLRQNNAYSPIQTWKLTAFNYLSAFSALYFGYKKAHLMYAWRGRTMGIVEEGYRRFFRARSKQNSGG